MTKGILGRKVGMTQVYDDAGQAIPVTVIQAGPCHVLQLKTLENDGYEAIQVGYLDKKRPAEDRPRSRGSQARRSERGHVTTKLNSKRAKKRAAAGAELPAKAECEPKKFVREFRGSLDGFEVGQEIKVTDMAELKAVDVVGTSKGRGFSGAMKRHNFSGQRATHGVKKCHRHLGGTGMSAYPSRTFKGKRMPGQYGAVRTTMRNLKLVKVDEENHLLVIRGAVPGPAGGFVIVRESNKVG